MRFFFAVDNFLISLLQVTHIEFKEDGSSVLSIIDFEKNIDLNKEETAKLKGALLDLTYSGYH